MEKIEGVGTPNKQLWWAVNINNSNKGIGVLAICIQRRK